MERSHAVTQMGDHSKITSEASAIFFGINHVRYNPHNPV